MKITIEPTDKIVTLDNGKGAVPARLWIGTTDEGTPCHAFITRICPTIPEPDIPTKVLDEFAAALHETKPARAVGPLLDGIPLYLII